MSTSPDADRPDDHRSAKADLKAAKARAKAMRPWYKKNRVILPVGVLALAVLGSAAGGGDDAAKPAAADAAPAAASTGAAAEAEPVVAKESAEPELAGLNAPVKDGKFEFVVRGMECGETLIGTDMFGSKAQGQFCIVDLTVTNTGDEAQYFLGDNAKLINAAGQEYSADTEAAVYLQDSSSLLEEINPGNTLEGKVVFDIPKDAQGTVLELHDSAFSGGVKVALA